MPVLHGGHRRGLAAFAGAHLRGLHEGGLLSAETFRRLHASHGGFGMGWGITETGGQPVSAHAGSAGTFFAQMIVWHGLDRAVVVMANAGAAENAVRAVCGHLIKILA